MVESKNSSLSAELLEVQRTLGWMDIVLGNITDAVFVTDKDARLVFANQAFSNLTDIPRVFLLGQNLNEVFEPQLMKNAQKEFMQNSGLLADESRSGANVYEWRNGDAEYIFKISYRLIPTTSQTVYIAKDITAEYALSLMKSNFINIASHQLRTPMTAIMTYAHMLHDGFGGVLDKRQKKLTKTIITSSERMIKLINDILFITRIQNGETNLLAQDGTVSSVFSRVESELNSRIKKKNIQVIKAYDTEALLTTCNTFVTHEIVGNLITNAVQYTPENGSITLNVALKKDQVILAVTDNGIGIPPEDLPNIFNQFSRANNAVEVFSEGTGLGLYVVKILVAQIQGTIDCQSQLGKGTTFTVTFPIKRGS